MFHSEDPLERAAALRAEASFILEEVQLFKILEPYGQVVLTGSYYLDLMMYPDIDLYISSIPISKLFDIAIQLTSCPLVFQIVFEKSQDAGLPGGLYLKPRLNYGDWGRPWKIDIWSLDDAIVKVKLAETEHFKHRLTAKLRQQILKYKYSILTSRLRTPMYSGYYIYKAFLDVGLTDFAQVTQYLVEHGISMD